MSTSSDATPEAPNGDFSRVWPLGPHCGDLADGAGPRAWVSYKLHAANWYIDTLEAAISATGFDRKVGVEMALDGALTSLCAAYDAASAALIGVAEAYLQLPKTDPWNYSPRLLREVMGKLDDQGIEGDISGTVAQIVSALVRRQMEKGWLTELQDLRNQAVHQDTIPRHFDAVVGSPTVGKLNIDGKPTEPIAYLRRAYQETQRLAGLLLDIVERVAPNGIQTLRPLRPISES